MILLVAGASNRGYPNTGDFASPRHTCNLCSTPIWAADNDAFNGFDPDRYRRMLDKILAAVQANDGARPPAFITVPDVVGDHWATSELFQQWHHEVSDRGLNRAFVLQNGIESAVESHGWRALYDWEHFEALFIGGDDRFKFCEAVRYLVAQAKALGKWVHMGRVNSIKRLQYAQGIGCNSCDGSGMARFERAVLAPMSQYLETQKQQTLFQFAA